MNTNNVLTKLLEHKENLAEFQRLQIVAILLFLLFETYLYIGLKKIALAFP